MSSGLVGLNNCVQAIPDLPRAAQERLFPFCQRAYADYPAVGAYGGNKAFIFSRFFDAPLLFAPGSRYSYSNTPFVLAAYLVEKVSGLAYADYLRTRVFEPAGLNATYYDPFDGQFALHEGPSSAHSTF